MPKDNWCIQKSTDEDNNMVFITANLGYRDYGFKAEFPWCLSVNMTIIDKNFNGHPTAPEALVLNQAEDLITAELEKVGVTHFVGRTTVNGSRVLYYFVADPDKANEALVPMTKTHQIREWEYRMEQDHQWLRVASFFDKNAQCL
ncbi:hypothetical protein GCM10023185_45360 [Hymenobacter saemangeumensis]|uniref:DUF695 domain-containing protein n=2 Tax=Hymenobacter saemangeumensis TaxID=1084522 RepID=A0ABP8IT80_9BACT